MYRAYAYFYIMNYKEHKENPKSFRALTGLTHIQFSHLLPYFEAAHDDYLSEYEINSKLRSQLRSFCIYKNSPLHLVSGHQHIKDMLPEGRASFNRLRKERERSFSKKKKNSTGKFPVSGYAWNIPSEVSSS